MVVALFVILSYAESIAAEVAKYGGLNQHYRQYKTRKERYWEDRKYSAYQLSEFAAKDKATSATSMALEGVGSQAVITMNKSHAALTRFEKGGCLPSSFLLDFTTNVCRHQTVSVPFLSISFEVCYINR